MIYYQISEIFTLIPQQFYSVEEGEITLQKMFGINTSYNVQSTKLDEYNAVLCYAVHQDILKDINIGDCVYPFIGKLLSMVSNSGNFNNALFHYNKELKLCHIIICENKELKIANCFKCDNFETAIYFMLLSVKKLNMNPKQTIIRVFSPISMSENQMINKFFRGTQLNTLDNSDIL